MLRKVINLPFWLIACMGLVSCGHRLDARKFEKLLEAETGQGHSRAKLYTLVGDYVVFKNNTTGEYSAYNMAKFDRKNMLSYSQYAAVAVEGVDIVRNLSPETVWVESGYWESIYETEYWTEEYWDEDCECWITETYSEEVYVGERWVDTSHYETFYHGGGFTFSNTGSASKDLETMAALDEKAAENFAASILKNSFSLSDGRASELAKMASKYQKLESIRSLTSEEKDAFTLKALGVDFSSVEKALAKKKSGSDAEYKEMLKKASKVNKTTSENIGRFIEEYVLQ